MTGARQAVQSQAAGVLQNTHFFGGWISAAELLFGIALLVAGFFMAYLALNYWRELRWLFKLKQRQKRARLSYSQHRIWAELQPRTALTLSRMALARSEPEEPPTNITPLPLPGVASGNYAAPKTAAA